MDDWGKIAEKSNIAMMHEKEVQSILQNGRCKDENYKKYKIGQWGVWLSMCIIIKKSLRDYN